MIELIKTLLANKIELEKFRDDLNNDIEVLDREISYQIRMAKFIYFCNTGKLL